MTVINTAQVDKERVIDACGNAWVEFSETIPDAHVEQHEKAIALILEVFPDSLLPTQIIELVVDENLDAHMRSVALRMMCYQNLLELVVVLGVTLNKEYVELKHLPLLVDIAEFFLVVTETDDVIQTVLPQLTASDLHPKYRFIHALAKLIYPEEEPDISELECVVDDCSVVALKALEDSILQIDGEDIPPDDIITRVVNCKETLEGSLGFTHIRNGGAVGSTVDNYLSFYRQELRALLKTENTDDFLLYGKHVISLYLISDLNTDRLQEALLTFFDGRIDDVTALIRIESMIKSLNLPPVIKVENE